MTTRALNYALYFLGVALLGTGLILKWKIPHGPEGRSIGLLGLDKHEGQTLNFVGGLSIAVLVIWHLVTHWKWVVHVAPKKNTGKLLAGFLTPAGLVAALALTPLEKSQAESCGNYSSWSSCSKSKNPQASAHGVKKRHLDVMLLALVKKQGRRLPLVAVTLADVATKRD